MKLEKVFNLTFYVYLLILLMFSIFKGITIYIHIIMTLVSLIFITINYKKIKHDKINLILFILPLTYIVLYLTGTYVIERRTMVQGIFETLSISLTAIVLRNTMVNKENQQKFLTWFQVITVISFFLSIYSYVYFDEFLKFKIFSEFGDTYVNTIDRFYGVLNYCNAQALIFMISAFITLIKKDKKIIDRAILFISMIGFSYCFSKMIFIDFIIITIILLIYNIIRKKEIEYIIFELLTITIPVFLSITMYRYFLINDNILLFLLTNSLCFGFYLILEDYIRGKYLTIPVILVIVITTIYTLINPILIPLTIKNVRNTKNSYVAEFMLEKGKEYNLELDYENLQGKEQFVLKKTYVENNVLKTYDYIIFNTNKATIKTDDDTEYFLLEIRNINPKTNLTINAVKLNGKKVNINTLIAPYQITKQRELRKYDTESVSHRFLYYKDAIKYIKENKYFYGRGEDAFAYYRITNFDNKYNELNPHNYVLEKWLNHGILGLFYIIFIYISGIVSMLRRNKNTKYTIWFIMFAGLGMFSFLDFYMSIPFIQVLFLLSYVIIVKDDYKKI